MNITHPITIAVLLASTVGCVSDRYVGSIGTTGTYSNRGYGLVVDLSQSDLLTRWEVFDPRDPLAGPAGMGPKIVDDHLDLNGDGVTKPDETARYLDPTLRLFNKADPSITIDVNVTILGGELREAPLDSLMKHVFDRAAGGSASADAWESRQLAPDFPALVGETGRVRVAAIDHTHFEAEDGVVRRQLIAVVLKADALTTAYRADFNAVLAAIALNHTSGRQNTMEQF